MTVPADLKYTKDHEWARVEGDVVVIGISDHAQTELGDITFVELPPLGKTVEAGNELAVIESVKAASDIYAPVNGTVAEVNDALEGTPEAINESPYGDGWICKLKDCDLNGLDALMSDADYTAHIED